MASLSAPLQINTVAKARELFPVPYTGRFDHITAEQSKELAELHKAFRAELEADGFAIQATWQKQTEVDSRSKFQAFGVWGDTSFEAIKAKYEGGR